MPKKNSAVSPMGEDDWRADSDLRTLIECEAIEADPKRLAKVQALAKKRLLDYAAIAKESPKD